MSGEELKKVEGLRELYQAVIELDNDWKRTSAELNPAEQRVRDAFYELEEL